MNATVIMANGGSEEGPAESADPVPTNSEVETYDRKNRDRFKTIRLGRRRDDSLGAVLPDVDQELAGPQPLLNGSGEDSGLSSSSSAFSRVDHNAAKMAGGPPSLANGGGRMVAGNGSNLPTMKTEPSGDDDEAVFKKPQAIQPSTMMQQPSGLARPGESRLRSTLSKPRYYGAAGPLQGTVGGIQRKDLTLPLGNKSSSADCLEQREEDDQYLLQQPQQQQRLSGDKSLQQQQPASRLATMSKLGGGSGGLLGTGRYSQFGLANKQLQLQQNQTVAGQPMGAPALKSPMGTKSKSYHSLTFAQANNSSGYGGSSGNLSKLHGSSALQLKLKHNSSNTELKSNTSKRFSLQQQAATNLRLASSSANQHQSAEGGGEGGRGAVVGRASLPLGRSPAAAQPYAARTGLNNSSTAAAMANKTALNTTTLSGGVQMRTASGLAKTSRLGLIRPSSGYFSYSTHRKHPDSDNESVNSLSSSSASSRGSLYRVDSQSIANSAQPPQFASATRTNSVEDVSGTSSSGNGLLTKLNGTGAGMGPGVLSAYASIEPPLPKNNPPVSSSMPAAPTTTGLKQPTAATGGAKPSGLRPPSAIRPPTLISPSLFVSASLNTCSRIRSISSARSFMSSSGAPAWYILFSSLMNSTFTSFSSHILLPSRSCSMKNVFGSKSCPSMWSCFSHTSSSCALLPGWCIFSWLSCLACWRFSSSSYSFRCCSSSARSFSCFSNSFCSSYCLNSSRRRRSFSCRSCDVFRISFFRSSISNVCGFEWSTCSLIFRWSRSISFVSSNCFVASSFSRCSSMRFSSSSRDRTWCPTYSSSCAITPDCCRQQQKRN
uniref:Uncharacterized protein n=1 Tax=Anopheles melas TaxID=34690 RepID=A0A182U018_9DIPT